MTVSARIRLAAFVLLAALLAHPAGAAALSFATLEAAIDQESIGGETPPPADRPGAVAPVQDWHYQLQEVKPDRIAVSRAGLAVVDPAPDSDAERFTPVQVRRMKMGNRRRIVAYLSIGEAESYRPYFDGAWVDASHRTTAAAPPWLDRLNKDWAGNYKVRYWDPAWQAIVFAALDRIVADGYDGVYLDIVDAYEYYGPDGASGLDRATAEREMVAFVKAIAARARAKNPRFLVIPQNAADLVRNPDYLQAISGIGVEDTWYNDDEAQELDHTARVLAALAKVRAAGKLALAIDYMTSEAKGADFARRARALGIVPFAGVRALDRDPR